MQLMHAEKELIMRRASGDIQLATSQGLLCVNITCCALEAKNKFDQGQIEEL